jgi:hypothetical protein
MAWHYGIMAADGTMACGSTGDYGAIRHILQLYSFQVPSKKQLHKELLFGTTAP